MDSVKVWCSSLTSESERRRFSTDDDDGSRKSWDIFSLSRSSLSTTSSFSLFLFFSSSEMEQKAVVRNNNRGCFARSDRWPRPLLSQNYDLPLPMTWPIPSHLLSDVYMLLMLYLCVLSSLLFFSPFLLPFHSIINFPFGCKIPNFQTSKTSKTSSPCPFLFLLPSHLTCFRSSSWLLWSSSSFDAYLLRSPTPQQVQHDCMKREDAMRIGRIEKGCKGKILNLSSRIITQKPARAGEKQRWNKKVQGRRGHARVRWR